MTTTCPACGAEVLEAQDTQGQPVLLHPTPSRSPLAPVAVWQDGDTLRARYPLPGTPLAAGERRHMPHARLCAGRGGARTAWGEAEAGRAAKGRRNRSGGRGAHAGARAGGFRLRHRGEHQ